MQCTFGGQHVTKRVSLFGGGGDGARRSVLGVGLCYKAGGRGFYTRGSEFLNLPNPPCCTSPGVYSSSNRN
jgi:hypothetical protein